MGRLSSRQRQPRRQSTVPQYGVLSFFFVYTCKKRRKKECQVCHARPNIRHAYLFFLAPTAMLYWHCRDGAPRYVFFKKKFGSVLGTPNKKKWHYAHLISKHITHILCNIRGTQFNDMNAFTLQVWYCDYFRHPVLSRLKFCTQLISHFPGRVLRGAPAATSQCDLCRGYHGDNK